MIIMCMMMIEQKIKPITRKIYGENSMNGKIICRKLADPCFDIFGLPDVIKVYFPVCIINQSDETVYVTCLIDNPPPGWNDSEQAIAEVPPFMYATVEKDNATRLAPRTPYNETIILRYNIRRDSFTGPIIISYTSMVVIRWRRFPEGGVIDDFDDFETDTEGWFPEGVSLSLSPQYSVSGQQSLCVHVPANGYGKIYKTVSIGGTSEAFLFGYILGTHPGAVLTHIISPLGDLAEDQFIEYLPYATWRRFGVQLVAGSTNNVEIEFVNRRPTDSFIHLDCLRFVHFL